MATEPRGYVPATSDVQTIINTARNRDLVIECTGASGVTHSFVHFDGGWWVANRVSKWNDDAWTVAPDERDSIRDCIRRCDPDVRLLEEANSTFGGKHE